ncbi:MAG: hypothetical protein JNK84_12945 [Phreatobacter sp.]|uniref:hypothetical protein n=1 Tax=Phreatobacter sp. TaxID=1966341 RepID=UPI001A5CB9FB|nr:hypothetical protein [Phreatobacter sp.]MBL8569972.1 hypothetical protein [Phreatobacter sp.]
MPLAAKDASALNLFSGVNPAETVAGPLVAAMMLPATLMMTGWMAFLGASFGAARIFAGGVRDEDRTEAAPVAAVVPPAPSVPRLVVSNPVAAERAPAQKAVEAKAKPAIQATKPVPAKPSGAPPKPSRPGEDPPKPKAAKPVPAKPSGAPPKPSRPGEAPPKPKAATAPEPVKAAPLKIETKATSKGISLPKVSMQDKPGEPDRN